MNFMSLYLFFVIIEVFLPYIKPTYNTVLNLQICFINPKVKTPPNSSQQISLF